MTLRSCYVRKDVCLMDSKVWELLAYWKTWKKQLVGKDLCHIRYFMMQLYLEHRKFAQRHRQLRTLTTWWVHCRECSVQTKGLAASWIGPSLKHANIIQLQDNMTSSAIHSSQCMLMWWVNCYRTWKKVALFVWKAISGKLSSTPFA